MFPRLFPTSLFIVWTLLSSSLHPLLLLPRLVNLTVPCSVVSLPYCHTLPAETTTANQSLCHLVPTSSPVLLRSMLCVHLYTCVVCRCVGRLCASEGVREESTVSVCVKNWDERSVCVCLPGCRFILDEYEYIHMCFACECHVQCCLNGKRNKWRRLQIPAEPAVFA